MSLKNKKVLLVLLFVATALFRFLYLGYSDYDSSELTVMKYVADFSENLDFRYFLDRRKGPLQWLVALIPLVFKADVYSEFIYRIPFAIASILSVFIFFKLIEKLTNNFWVAFISTALFSFNGFHVVFGRVVQYQSLNLLFSYLSVLLLVYANDKKSDLLYLASGLSLVLSFLAHWDAVFILPLLAYLLYTYKPKFHYTFSFVLPLLLAGVFLLFPYINNYLENESNQSYFSERVGMVTNLDYSDFFFRTELFNPFLYLPLFFLVSIAGLLVFKKSKIFYVQFLFALLYFLIIGKSPGSHVYNFFIPLYVIFSILIVDFSKKYLKIVVSLSAVVLSFLVFQSFILFVENKTEYPVEREKILFLETKEYNHENLQRHIFGFTHGRNWNEIAEYLDSVDPDRNLKFKTNALATKADFYTGREEGTSQEFFAVGVKRPTTFVNEYKLPQIENKSEVVRIRNKFGETTAVIYSVSN